MDSSRLKISSDQFKKYFDSIEYAQLMIKIISI